MIPLNPLKKGKTTDYVKRQYIGNLGKVENGIVTVTAYGLLGEMTFPLMQKVYKPAQRLKKGDEYKSKPKIGGEIIKELKEKGFKIKLVLADSEYGESEERYIREIIYGKKREIRYWQVTDNKETLPKNSTWDIMTKIQGITYKEVGNLYGCRNWVEYGLKQSKNELVCAYFRVTEYSRIEKWWKNILNNLRLVLQPLFYFNLLKPWFVVLFKPRIIKLCCSLFSQINQFINSIVETMFPFNYCFSFP